MAEEVLCEVDGAVARVTVNRPERRNALRWDTVRELRQVLGRAGADAGVRVVVLAGAGDRAFCAGADLAGMAAAGDVAEAHADRGELGGLFLDLWELGKPTVARVQGAALAGGFALALACDLVVAADDAFFGVPEIDVGLWPYVATVPLIRSMPPKVALELMMTGRRVGAAEAERIGFVNRVVPAADLDGAVAELTATLAAKPPGPMRTGRDSFYATWGMGAREALAVLHPLLTMAGLTEEAREGTAAFAEKRPPSWRDPR
ncbi:MAG TPA: enoyl-CoA hydratase-related protein [Acidimicrobiales bacterium]|nr:enoyl-CoA hydratase-related protein [Acidimicrobiales bacterium]